MARKSAREGWLLGAVGMLMLMGACGLKSSTLATRPPGHVKEDAGPDAEVVATVDGPARPNPDRPPPAPDPSASIDCQGSEEQVDNCIINAPTKSGLPATRSKPPFTYQTCGAQ